MLYGLIFDEDGNRLPRLVLTGAPGGVIVCVAGGVICVVGGVIVCVAGGVICRFVVILYDPCDELDRGLGGENLTERRVGLVVEPIRPERRELRGLIER